MRDSSYCVDIEAMMIDELRKLEADLRTSAENHGARGDESEATLIHYAERVSALSVALIRQQAGGDGARSPSLHILRDHFGHDEPMKEPPTLSPIEQASITLQDFALYFSTSGDEIAAKRAMDAHYALAAPTQPPVPGEAVAWMHRRKSDGFVRGYYPDVTDDQREIAVLEGDEYVALTIRSEPTATQWRDAEEQILREFDDSYSTPTKDGKYTQGRNFDEALFDMCRKDDWPGIYRNMKGKIEQRARTLASKDNGNGG